MVSRSLFEKMAGELLDPQYSKIREAVAWAGRVVTEQRGRDQDDAKN
jgi:hypothetical protein